MAQPNFSGTFGVSRLFFQLQAKFVLFSFGKYRIDLNLVVATEHFELSSCKMHDIQTSVPSRHSTPSIWSDEFRPCWYLVAIPVVIIGGTLIVICVKKRLAGFLLIKLPVVSANIKKCLGKNAIIEMEVINGN